MNGSKNCSSKGSGDKQGRGTPPVKDAAKPAKGAAKKGKGTTRKGNKPVAPAKPGK